MITIADWIILPLMTIFFWQSSFLYHELMHIKSQGLLMTGRIWVEKYGYLVSADEIYNDYYYRLAGGFYSGIIHLIVGGILWYYQAWGAYVPAITFGMMNLAYGFWEAEKGPEGRYKIYGIVALIMVILWIIHYIV